jgi:hypothetical protein
MKTIAYGLIFLTACTGTIMIAAEHGCRSEQLDVKRACDKGNCDCSEKTALRAARISEAPAAVGANYNNQPDNLEERLFAVECCCAELLTRVQELQETIEECCAV